MEVESHGVTQDLDVSVAEGLGERELGQRTFGKEMDEVGQRKSR